MKCLYLLLIPFVGHSQELPKDNGLVVYEKILEIDSLSKDDIYTYSKRWLSIRFKNAAQAIQSDDKEAGEIVSMGSMEVKNPEIRNISMWKILLDFKILINAKDGRARIRFHEVNRLSEGEYDYYRTPIESIETYYKQVKSKRKAESWEKLASSINNDFNMLMEDYSTSITEYSADKF